MEDILLAKAHTGTRRDPRHVGSGKPGAGFWLNIDNRQQVKLVAKSLQPSRLGQGLFNAGFKL